MLQFKAVEKPAPTDGQILVKIYAASANPLDWHLMRASPFLARLAGGLRRPKDPRLGADFAGRVEAVGANVAQFQPGDEVFGASTGAFAEYLCVAESQVALKPANLSFEEAAAVAVAATTALQGLRDAGQIRSGQKVLVNGASVRGRLPCRSPVHSALRSPACVARETWIWCAPLARTTRLIT